jgi:hypothetical protein
MTRLPETPPSIAALGLTWPTTADAIRHAYRTRADACLSTDGGALDAFIDLQRAYEDALALAEPTGLTGGPDKATVHVTKLPRISQEAYRIDVRCSSHTTQTTIVPGPTHPGLRAAIRLAVVEHEHDRGQRCDTSEAHVLNRSATASEEVLAAEQAILHAETVRLRSTIVNLGILGWRWIVWHPNWRGRDHIRQADMLDTGLCASSEEAHTNLQRWGTVEATHEETRRAVYRLELRNWRKVRRAKTTRTKNGPGSQSAEYVYLLHEHADSCDSDCNDDPIPHQVMEKTEKSYVVYAHAATTPVSPNIYQRETFVLNRKMLEKGKSVVRHATPGYGRWTLKPHVAVKFQDHSSMAACFAALGLRWPTTETAVRLAYRRLALACHPDTGGSHGEFLELNRHYRQALSMVMVPV